MLDMNGIKQDIRAELKPRKIIRYALVPHFGGLFSPMKDVFAIFVRTIGLMFVQAKLIAKDHPAMTGEVRGIGAIWQMVLDASANLEFKKENARQLSVFYAIVGTMVFAVFSVVAFLMQLAVGHAHAATSYFTDSNTTLAYGWVESMFPANVAGGGAYTGTGAITFLSGLTPALGGLLTIYNSGILVLAVIMAMWSIVSMVTDSAHHGKVGGERHSELYAPIRLVFAIGMLVPVSNGYNTAQLGAIALAHAGSGLANNVWNSLVGNLAPTGNIPLIAGPDLSNFTQTAIIDATCEATFFQQGSGNISISEISGDYSVATQVPASAAGAHSDIPTALNSLTYSGSNVSRYKVNFNYRNGDAKCGSIEIPAPDPMVDTTNPQAYLLTYLLKIYPTAAKIGINIAGRSTPGSGTYNTSTLPTFNPYNDWGDAIRQISAHLDAEATLAVSSYVSGTAVTALMTQVQTQGWAAAGSSFFGLANVASNEAKLQNRNLTANLPDIDLLPVSMGGTPANVANCPGSIAAWFVNAPAYCIVGAGTVTAAIDNAHSFTQTAQSSVGLTPTQDEAGTPNVSNKGSTLFNRLAKAINPASFIKLVGSTTGYTTYADPMFTAIYYGNWLAAGDAALFLATAVIGGTIFGQAAAWVTMMFGAILYPFALTLGIYLPLMPAMRFLFGILTWLLTLFEAMLGLPIVMLWHLNSQGEGLLAHGKEAYLLVLQMMLRPVLMIFGLLASILAFDIMFAFVGTTVGGTWLAMNANLLNSSPTTISDMGSSFGSWLLGFGFMLVYVSLIYMVANISFQMINTIPDRILLWIGSAGITHADGSEQAIGSAGQQISAGHSGGQQGLGQLQQGMRGKVLSDQRDADAARLRSDDQAFQKDNIGRLLGSPSTGTGSRSNSVHIPGDRSSTEASAESKSSGSSGGGSASGNANQVPNSGTPSGNGFVSAPSSGGIGNASPFPQQPGISGNISPGQID